LLDDRNIGSARIHAPNQLRKTPECSQCSRNFTGEVRADDASRRSVLRKSNRQDFPNRKAGCHFRADSDEIQAKLQVATVSDTCWRGTARSSLDIRFSR
jgi:transcriptional regulator NrdR family protein